MDYTHKFSSGALHMDHMIEEYLSLRKMRGYCQRCPKYGKYWSCPDYGFDEKLFLNEFKFMYLIGREYTIPKKDRQTTIGIQASAQYCIDVHNAMKVESWKDLLELEKDLPGTLSLMPGNCHVCDVAGLGCAREKGLRCRHHELMRFSLEGLGFDVDAMSKFEMGLLLRWPREGHLPEKLSCVMAILSNEKLPMAVIKKHFHDVKRSYLRAGQTILGEDENRGPKRVESWLDHQAKELQQKEEQEDSHGTWLGFKSDSLDSGDYVKERTWAQGDDEYPDAPPELDDRLEGDRVAPPERAADEPQAAAPASAPKGPMGPEPEDVDENGQPKYRWLGFKRTPDEAEEIMMERPIPKFSVSEEEKEAADQAPEEGATAAETLAAAAQPSGKDEAGHNPLFDKQTFIKEELERALRREMPNASEAEIVAMVEDALGIQSTPKAPSPAAPVAARETAEPAEAAPVAEVPQPEPVVSAPAQERVQREPEERPAVRQESRPEPKRPEPEPEPEPIELPDASTVKDVLGAALKIAQRVIAEPEPEPEPAAEPEKDDAMDAALEQIADELVRDVKSGARSKAQAAPSPQDQPAPEEEDDSKYKWLGFKSKVAEEDGFKKGGWKKNF